VLATPWSQIVGIHVNRHAGDAVTDDEGDDSDSDIYIYFKISSFVYTYTVSTHVWVHTQNHKKQLYYIIIIIVRVWECAASIIGELKAIIVFSGLLYIQQYCHDVVVIFMGKGISDDDESSQRYSYELFYIFDFTLIVYSMHFDFCWCFLKSTIL